MLSSLGRRGRAILAVGLFLLIPLATVEGRSPPPNDNPPGVEDPPPGTGQGCTGDCDPNPPDTPPGNTNHMPEPATLLSGLIGAGILSVYARRRRQQVVEE